MSTFIRISALVYTKQRDNTQQLRALPASFYLQLRVQAGQVLHSEQTPRQTGSACPRHSRTGATPGPCTAPSQSQRSSPEQWRSISLHKYETTQSLCNTSEEGPFLTHRKVFSLPRVLLQLAGECFPHSTNAGSETRNHSWRRGQQKNLSDGTKRMR